jgi:hypothetical protein
VYVQCMSALPPAVHALLDLFRTALAEVRFADIDADALARAAAEVDAAAAHLEVEETKLVQLRHDLQERQDALLVQAQRALSYARVYAENDAQLSERLGVIALGRPVKRSKVALRATREHAAVAGSVVGDSTLDEPLLDAAPRRSRNRPQQQRMTGLEEAGAE